MAHIGRQNYVRVLLIEYIMGSIRVIEKSP